MYSARLKQHTSTNMRHSCKKQRPATVAAPRKQEGACFAAVLCRSAKSKHACCGAHLCQAPPSASLLVADVLGTTLQQL